MLFRRHHCHKYSFEEICPTCQEAFIELYVPLDPKHYREFRYSSQGFVKDLLYKRQKQEELARKLQSVLEKYNRFKYPYFVNFLHIARGGFESSQTSSSHDVPSSQLYLFHNVLTRLGFDELNEFPNLTRKLVMSTELDFSYSNFVLQVERHIGKNLRDSMYSWIGENGPLFRRELPLFLFYIWQKGLFREDIQFNEPTNVKEFVPLMSESTVGRWREWCERIFVDIQITRFKITLEGFDPQQYLNIYMIDSMSGFEFEDLLVKLFSCIGYDVEETRRSQDQGADLFLKRFGKKIVVQAKNYADNVGNSGVQQAVAAKAFYGCDEAMVVTNSHFTPSAVELAKATNVTLVDRDELAKYIDEYNQAVIEQRSHVRGEVDQGAALESTVRIISEGADA